MSAPLREQLKNKPKTTLNGSINNSVTSITVTDGSVFPSAGNFHLRVEDEIMVCTARATNVLTVARGQEGTTGASHADLTDVAQQMSVGTFERWGQDSATLWADSSILPLSTLVDDSAVGILASDFTWVNQGGASVTDQAGTIVQRHPTTANSPEIRALTRSAPSPSYSYVAALQLCCPAGSAGASFAAIGFRQSGTGKLIGFVLTADVTGGAYKLAVANYNSPTSLFTTSRGELFCFTNVPLLWLKIEDDNTNLKFYVGDGVEWVLVCSTSRGGFMSGGPDQVWWGGSNSGNGSNESLVRLCHWSRNS